MASSGYYDATFGGHPFTLRFNWSVASQNIAGNFSTINWNLQIIKTVSYSPYNNNSTNPWNTNTASGNFGPYNFNGGIGQTIQIASGTYNIGHNADGTGTISASFYANANSTITTASGSGSTSLPTIPRATVPTVSPTSGNMDSVYGIGYAGASTSFAHDLFFSVDGGSSYATLATDLGYNGTFNYTPPSSLLPSSTDVTAIILLRTKSGPGGSTIGDKTINLPLHVPDSVVPTVSGVSFVDAQTSAPDMPTLMGGAGRFVQNWSKLLPTITSAGASGSTVTASSVTQNGQVAQSGSAFGSAISLNGAVPYSASATDTRNRTSATYNSTIAVTAYNYPSLPIPTVQRTSDAAGTTPSATGTYLRITPSASVSSLVFGGVEKNLIEYQVRTRPVGGAWTTVTAWTAASTSGMTWTSNLVISGYASTTSYDVEVSLRDMFGKNGYSSSVGVVQTVNVPTEAVFMDLDGAAGIGIGKYHSLGMLDVAGQIYQNNGDPVMAMGLNNGSSLDVTGGDWNMIDTTGFFRGASVANAPDYDPRWFYVTVNRHDRLFVHQLATYYFGGVQADDTYTVSTLWQRVNNNGTWTTWREVGGPPVGSVIALAGANAPSHYLLCDGSAVSRTTYDYLFAAIGTTYGAGDGTTTFNVPDMRSRVPVGKNSSGTFVTLGGSGGEEAHTLSVAEMPSHSHQYSTNTSNGIFSSGGGTGMDIRGSNNASTAAVGGGAAHNNLQPYVVLNYVIKT